MKKQAGITLVLLIVTIIIIALITVVIIRSSMGGMQIKDLNNMYSDIKILNDKVFAYYNQYNKLPTKGVFNGNQDYLQVRNGNDDNIYYVIDIEKLNNLSLTRKITGIGNDVYIVNNSTHTIYYPQGVRYEGNTYYTLP